MMLIFVFILLLVPLTAWSAPVHVTLFPTSAVVGEVVQVTPVPGEGGFTSYVLNLPGQADPATLRFGALPGETTIADITWTARQEANQEALRTLNPRLAELKAQRNAILAEQAGLRGRMSFWEAQNKPVEQSIAALQELAAEMGQALEFNAQKLLVLDQKLEEVDQAIAVLEEEIDQAAGQHRRVWEVTVLCHGPVVQEFSLDYTMDDCGWTPLYRLEAKPQEKIIDFSWQAKVWQRSGQDWSQVALRLATMQPEFQGEPGQLRPWEIQTYTPTPQERTRSINMAPAGALMSRVPDEEDFMAAAAPVPEEVRYTTYAAWDMGQRSLPAGETRVFSLKKEIWAAEFIHLLRPSLDTKAYVQAKINFDEPKDFPRGSAFYLIDGATVDQKQFALSGKESTMFFGVDPFLTCEVTLRDKKTGDKGLFKSKQTFARHWDLVITNAATHALDYRLEEPKPISRDDRIKLNLNTTPATIQEDDPKIMAWTGQVEAGATQKISISLSFEAPGDLTIDLGRYW